MNNNMDTVHQAKDIDMTNTDNRIILVKVPKCLKEAFISGPPGSQIGELKILPSGKVMFVVSKQHLTTDVPLEHEFVANNIAGNDSKMFIMSQEKIPLQLQDSREMVPGGKVAVEGTVNKKYDMRPVMNENYAKWIKSRNELVNKPTGHTVILKEIIQDLPNIANYVCSNNNNRYEKEKNFRQDKDVLKKKLIMIFQKHQYYKFNDLIKLTKQPVAYLKEVLREIGTQNVSGIHSGTWELKKDFGLYSK